MKFLVRFSLFFSLTLPALAQTQEYPSFKYTSYGYFLLSQSKAFKDINNLKPYTKREIDMPEFALEGRFLLNEKSAFEFEVEFEHYGTGSAMEFDNFEEFGEFETEMEKGGEVVLHEVYYEKEFDNGVEVKVGRAPIFISLSSVLTHPAAHLNVTASDLEYRMIPLEWTETGVQLEKAWGPVTIRTGVVTGLDSEFFNSPTWVGNGHQRRFDTALANNLAGLLAIEYGSVKEAQGIALAGYYGDTAENRYKLDKITEPAHLTLISLLANYKFGRFGVMGQSIWGTLENSDVVSEANNTLPNAVKANQVDLGHKAQLQTLQLSYELSDSTAVFVQKEHVNTFEEVRGLDYANPHYNRELSSAGLRYAWDGYCFMKAQYGKQKTKLTGSPETDVLRLAFGFDLDKL